MFVADNLLGPIEILFKLHYKYQISLWTVKYCSFGYALLCSIRKKKQKSNFFTGKIALFWTIFLATS